MATNQLAVIFKNPTIIGEFLLVKQTPPPSYDDQEYDSYIDSDLWDLPSAKLSSLSPEEDPSAEIVLHGEEACLQKLNLRKFDLRLALDQKCFKAGCRQLLGLDGKFMNDPFPRQLLTVVGVNSNYGAYPVSYALVEAKTMNSWTWFLKCIGEDLDLHMNSSFTFISNKQKVLRQVGFGSVNEVEWKFLKFVEEPNFGPGLPIETVYLTGELGPEAGTLRDNSMWSCIKSCFNRLLQGKPGCERLGPLVVEGLLKDSTQSESVKMPPTFFFQEYPPGVNIVPMGSRTAKPYHTTNLVVFAPGSNHVDYGSSFVAHGDAMIVDPGCRSEFNEELAKLIASLPRKLIVFVTHHHRDHVDGLSVVQKTNPDARLLVHENTMRRITKDDWSLGYTTVSGEEEICIGGQKLKIIFAPGHTDGHLALLHVSTRSLIVGDHCVGQGSALLDIKAGGNMSDYFQTTYKFMDLSPNALIPMHGRVNLWPKHMLCGYLKNRRSRESTILKAIEEGSKTLFDIVAYTYADVDRGLWIHASSNVRLHVDHLAVQDKLPKDFSLENFSNSCDLFAGQVGKL